ncbi:hypothetical protein [Deinococcus sp. QL22]|uniref:hypothetical protein n=1 Tax=Deinococcus sp. QL22 TaxID=2939437 RepID=UPI002016C86B|nr:hypothetical protein [Deinococcus sp. QL22]UQN10145.1 hypothetical protein M1R55_28580 [Deinococcus sp. QL22]
MNLTPFTPNTGRKADARTFHVLTVVRECGVTVDTEMNVVTLTRNATGNVATIDGEATTMDQAVRLLKGAEIVWLQAEVLSPVAPMTDTLSKAEACDLHRLLGSFGFRNHYAVAEEMVGREVRSLTQVTADEAALIRSYAYGQFGLVG